MVAETSKALLDQGEDEHGAGDCDKLFVRVTLEKISWAEISLQCLNIVSKQ